MNQHPKEVFKEHHHEHCLNCGQAIQGNFCSRCGQNTHTHRLSIWHFIVHDLVHSFWHVDNGVLFTIEEVLIRPGAAAMDYIRGKRVGRFPILTLVLILLGISFWLFSKMGVQGPEPKIYSTVRQDSETYKMGMIFFDQMKSFVTHYKKWLVLSLLPVGALSSFIVFRKARMNYTEHLLLNSYVFAGALVVVAYMLLFSLCLPDLSNLFSELAVWLVIALYLLAYIQAIKCYKIPGLLWRFVAFAALNYFFVIVLIVIGVIAFAVELEQSGALSK